MRISDWSSDVCSSDLGFDQLVVIETPQRANADIFLRFYNADGGESAACGNGTRCVAGSLMQEMGRDDLVVETAAGVLTAWRRSNGLVAVDMGFASPDWNEVPLAAPADTLHLALRSAERRVGEEGV